jgi:hypothetical protein
MQITIKIIPHNEQRYPTCGDWQFLPNGDLLITISEMGDWKKEFLVAFHELAEVMLCKDRGIQQELVDRFDMEYEKNRSDWDQSSEPGDAAGSPYHREHFFATTVERLMCAELGVDWGEYEKTIMGL